MPSDAALSVASRLLAEAIEALVFSTFSAHVQYSRIHVQQVSGCRLSGSVVSSCSSGQDLRNGAPVPKRDHFLHRFVQAEKLLRPCKDAEQGKQTQGAAQWASETDLLHRNQTQNHTLIDIDELD